MIRESDFQPPLFVGVDVGGTNIKLGIIDDEGHIVVKAAISTHEERGPAEAVGRIGDTIERCLKEHELTWDQVQALGIGTPGPMDILGGLVTDPPTMPHWRNYPLRDELSRRCHHKPVAFTNDANAAAFGEFWLGRGRDAESLVLLTLGTGVGGGIILGGQLINGANSFGGEVGMMVIDSSDSARECAWGGQHGQLEAYSSASAVVARMQGLLDAGVETRVRQSVDAGEELNTKLIGEAAEVGDEVAQDVILEAARYLGIGVTNLVHVLDPGVILLGGAMTFGKDETQTGRDFIKAVRQEFASRSFPEVVDRTRVAYASLGSDAGFIGAAGLSRV